MPATALPPGHGHIIVCGVEHLGLRTIDELRRRDEDVVAIGPTADAEEELTTQGVRLVVGDPLLARTLRAADIERAAAIVMTGGEDLENLNIALAAQELQPGIRVIIRMFDTELGGHIPDLFADGVALSSSALAAPGFVTAAIDGETGGRFDLAGRVLSSRTSADPARGHRSVPIARLRADRSVEILPDASSGEPDLVLIDIATPDEWAVEEERTVAPRADASTGGLVPGVIAGFRERLRAPEQRLLRFGTVLVLLAVVSALYFEYTAGLTPLDAVSYAITLLTGASLVTDIDPATAPASLRIYGIFLSLVGAALVAIVYAFITDALIRSRLLQTLGRRTVPGDIREHVVVAGLGAIGYRTALGIRARGVPVVVVESQDDGRFVSATRAAGIPVVIGDARHRDVLDEVRLARARALVCATSDDLVNLSAALNGRAIRPDLRVVVRLFDPDFALRVQRGFGIRFTRSVSQLAAPAFAAAATRTEVVATVPIGDRRMALFARLRVPAGSALEGSLAASLDRTGARRVLAVADPGSDVARWDVPPDEVLDEGEEVVVVASRAGLAELLHLASSPAGSTRTIADLPPPGPAARHLLPFHPVDAVSAVLHGVERAIQTLPPPIGQKRPARPETVATVDDPLTTD
ncbi:MAG: NAD-binding protein [Candidatus Limnocylindrales bacterium]